MLAIQEAIPYITGTYVVRVAIDWSSSVADRFVIILSRNATMLHFGEQRNKFQPSKDRPSFQLKIRSQGFHEKMRR